MINRFSRVTRHLVHGAAVVAVLGLGGCGAVEGVEFNGKVFEAVGLTGALGGKRAEPKTEPRAPLVLPPASQQLPEPGAYAEVQPASAHAQWPDDADKRKSSSEEAKKQAQEKYCRDGNWKEKAMGDDINAAAGPAGSCSGNVFTLIGKSLFGE